MSATRIDPPAFHYGDGIIVLAKWRVTTTRCGCACYVGPTCPKLDHVGCVTKECGPEHLPLVADFRRRWADRVPRFPSDWPQMPAVEVDVVWQESERFFYSRAAVERTVGS